MMLKIQVRVRVCLAIITIAIDFGDPPGNSEGFVSSFIYLQIFIWADVNGVFLRARIIATNSVEGVRSTLILIPTEGTTATTPILLNDKC